MGSIAKNCKTSMKFYSRFPTYYIFFAVFSVFVPVFDFCLLFLSLVSVFLFLIFVSIFFSVFCFCFLFLFFGSIFFRFLLLIVLFFLFWLILLSILFFFSPVFLAILWFIWVRVRKAIGRLHASKCIVELFSWIFARSFDPYFNELHIKCTLTSHTVSEWEWGLCTVQI